MHVPTHLMVFFRRVQLLQLVTFFGDHCHLNFVTNG